MTNIQKYPNNLLKQALERTKKNAKMLESV